MGCCTCSDSTMRRRGRPRKWRQPRFKSLIGLAFQTRIVDRVSLRDMSEQPQGGSTGRWLKRITQSMSGEPRDLAELIEDLREASERGLFDGDALVMLEGVLAVADMQVRDIMVP